MTTQRTPEAISTLGASADPPADGPQAAAALRLASDSLISIADIRRIFGLGRTAAYELTRRPGFPNPVAGIRRAATGGGPAKSTRSPPPSAATAHSGPRQTARPRLPDPATPPRRITGTVRAARTSKKKHHDSRRPSRPPGDRDGATGSRSTRPASTATGGGLSGTRTASGSSASRYARTR